MVARMRAASSRLGTLAAAPGRSALASLTTSPAMMRSSLTPRPSARAAPPSAMSPEALATSATVMSPTRRYAGDAACSSVAPMPACAMPRRSTSRRVLSMPASARSNAWLFDNASRLKPSVPSASSASAGARNPRPPPVTDCPGSAIAPSKFVNTTSPRSSGRILGTASGAVARRSERIIDWPVNVIVTPSAYAGPHASNTQPIHARNDSLIGLPHLEAREQAFGVAAQHHLLKRPRQVQARQLVHGRLDGFRGVVGPEQDLRLRHERLHGGVRPRKARVRDVVIPLAELGI